MKFKKWVEKQGGTARLAEKLGLDTPTVNHWIWRNATPRPKMMQKIVRLGRGAFSYDDLINDCAKKPEARR